MPRPGGASRSRRRWLGTHMCGESMPGGVPGADTVRRVSPGVVDWRHRDPHSVHLFLSSRRKDQGREAHGRKLY